MLCIHRVPATVSGRRFRSSRGPEQQNQFTALRSNNFVFPPAKGEAGRSPSSSRGPSGLRLCKEKYREMKHLFFHVSCVCIKLLSVDSGGRQLRLSSRARFFTLVFLFSQGYLLRVSPSPLLDDPGLPGFSDVAPGSSLCPSVCRPGPSPSRLSRLLAACLAFCVLSFCSHLPSVLPGSFLFAWLLTQGLS